MADEISDRVRRRELAPRPVASALDQAVSGLGGARERQGTASAWVDWMRVNGDVERRHTTGVFVAAPRRGETDPSLTVYVDSNAYLTDFSANRDIYLARLASAGLRFSRVEFRRSKRPRAEAAPVAARTRPAPPRQLPELDAEEAREVDELCSALPTELRESVSRAMRASYRAQKEEHS